MYAYILRGQQRIIAGVKTKTHISLGNSPAGNFGIILETESNKHWFYGTPLPGKIIQGWRAIKLIDGFRDISYGMLEWVWHSVERNLSADGNIYTNKLRGKFKIPEQFDLRREEILMQAPDPRKLECIIKELFKNKITVCFAELEEEIKLGALPPLNILKTIKEKN